MATTGPEDPVFRPATEDDVEALTALERDTNEVALAHVFRGVPYPYDDVRARWLRLVADPGVCVEVVGAAERLDVYLAWDADRPGRLRHLGVRPEAWGQGLARRAVERASGVRRLWVLRENARARGFYEHLGWAPTGREQKAEWPPYPVELEYSPMTDSLLEIADELYALPQEGFTPARDARAKELKSDKDLATAVKKLKKPSVAAWVVNLFVRREADQVDQLIAVGQALREAQEGMDGAELRALTRQRRQLTSAVTQQARALAKDEGVKVTSAVSDQVEATLTAAMVDPECAKAVRSGMLTAALAATGVDTVDVAAAVAVPDALGFTATPTSGAEGGEPSPPDLHVVPADPDDEADRRREEARAAVAVAQETVAETESSLAESTEAVEELQARSLQLQSEIDEVRRRLSELETAAEETDEELEEAEQTQAEAQSAHSAATKARDAAQKALDKLS